MRCWCVVWAISECKLQLDVRKDKENIVVYLSEQTLALNEVTVTAERKAIDATTAYTLGRTALDHLQSVSVSDALSLFARRTDQQVQEFDFFPLR